VGVRTEKDFEELLGLLNRNKVKYCIVGAYAVAFYSKPRYTKDIDIFIEPSRQNARRIIKALVDFGFGSLNLQEKDFCGRGKIIQLGYEPIRIDILTSLEAVDFKRAWRNRKRGNYGSQRVNFIGIDDLICTKKKAGRLIDKIDLSNLKKVIPRRKVHS